MFFLDLTEATQIEYTREIPFIASAKDKQGKPEILGVVRAWAELDNIAV